MVPLRGSALMQIYVVGGAVRDELLGFPVKDRDYVVVGATPEQMAAQGFKPVGADFPVFLHPETHAEYALARTERKTAPGYKGFVFHASPDVTLEQDLARRDLTINAMARDEQGLLIDPFGGERDLKARLLRHVSPAFAEDPVRILRVARFAARFGFSVAPETLELMRHMAENGEVDALVAERVWQELARGLMEQTPSRMFQVLRECGALQKVLPEVERLFGVPQPEKSHPEIDTGLHVMMVIDAAAQHGFGLAVRFAALTHDLGKGVTPREQWPRHPGHEEKSVELVKELSNRIKVPNDCRDLAVIAARWHGQVHKALELGARELLDILDGADALRRPERFAELLDACAADHYGRQGFESAPYPQKEYLRAAQQRVRELDYTDITSGNGDIPNLIRARKLEALEHFLKEKR
jgi:tRNA nucleotidyltransferase (CCA-adding enzyme)